jgi:hypothetical protein
MIKCSQCNNNIKNNNTCYCESCFLDRDNNNTSMELLHGARYLNNYRLKHCHNNNNNNDYDEEHDKYF